MEKSIVSTINNRHICSVDKYYRMMAGLSSELTFFNEETLYLRIQTTEMWKKRPGVTARQLAECWRSFNVELSGLKKYVVILDQKSRRNSIVVSGIFY